MKRLAFPMLALFALLTIASESLAETVNLRAGTIVPVRLAQNVSGSISNPGDRIYFAVTQDVYAEGKVVIPKGTFVTGMVNASKKQGMVGKGGELTIVPRSVPSIDGQSIRLVKDPLGSQGKPRTGAVVTNVVLWGVLGFVTKGKAAGILIDTEYDLEVASDATINLDQVVATNTQAPQTVKIHGFFEEYKKKIKFNKGKEGKNFELSIDIPDIFDPSQISVNDIWIESVFGYKLPENPVPLSISPNKKDGTYVLEFEFWDLAQYLAPGDAPVVIHVQLSNMATGECHASINTDWKM